MFENNTSRTLPLPYPSLPSYGRTIAQLPYQLPPLVPLKRESHELPFASQHPSLPTSTSSPASSESSLASGSGSRSSVSLPDLHHSHNLHQGQIQPKSSIQQPTTTTTTTTTRRKKLCPECNLYFSNLATHKSTHLSLHSRPHVCPRCSRGFARANDLIRHENSHLKEVGKFLYKCPYYKGECHSNGCFSRCDTFKNHLKLLHFLYPTGTRKKDRGKVSGECKLCGGFYRNVDEWLKLHVDTGTCPGITNTPF